MAYLPNYQYDIFISYAHVDNQPGRGRWVDQFHESLESCIAQQFGRSGSITIWRDTQLPGNEIFDSSIIEICQGSALLVCITSPGYMASTEWCQREYEAFCLTNQAQYPPRHGNRSRIFNVRLREPLLEEHKKNYEKMFRQSLGYVFYNPGSGSMRDPAPSNVPAAHWSEIEKLASDILTLLMSMRDDIMSKEPDPSAINEHINELIETGTAWGQLGGNAAALYPGNLHEVLQQARERLIISAHTLNKFSDDPKVLYTLLSLLHNKVKVTLIMLNPKSKYADAHSPYHELESKEGTAEDQHKKSLEFLSSVFRLLDAGSKERFEVLLSNYMPRFRTILVDDERAYLYLYMYGEDLTDYPDFVLKKTDQVFTRILASMHKLLIEAPEIIPYIRYGRIYAYWGESELAKWDSWTPKVRERHKIIHQYYVLYATDFDKQFYNRLEDYVQEHLELLSGRTLVLGCGSGKEVKYLANGKKCSELYGIDFSHQAISIAIEKKRKYYPNSNAQFIVADFYDLEHVIEGEFDSIVANAAFVHLFERDHMSTILRCIWRKLKPGGLCFIRNLYKEEIDGNPVNHELDESPDAFDKRWFVYFLYTNLAQLARDAGFSVKDDVTREIGEKCGFSEAEMKVVMNKGFKHERYKTVRWPTILLEKPR